MGNPSPEAIKRMTVMRGRRLKRARELGTHTREQWLALCAQWEFRCLRCARSDVELSKDHIIALCDKNSSDSIDNIQPLCKPCNSGRWAVEPDWREFRLKYGFERCSRGVIAWTRRYSTNPYTYKRFRRAWYMARRQANARPQL